MSRLPLIIGHRGASAHAPENTLTALRMAFDAGADGVEFDVRLASDGVPVVIHDGDLRRVAGRNVAVAQLSSADLASIDVGSWFNSSFPAKASAAYSDETVPSLEQVLNLLADTSGPVYLELKTDGLDPEKLVRACVDLIRTSPLLPRMIVKSFHLAALQNVRKELPDIEIAALFEPGVKTVFRRRSNLVSIAAANGARYVSLHWSLVNRSLMEAAKELQMPVTVWTVDQPKWVSRASAIGIGALITNDPGKLLAACDRSLVD